MAKDTQFQIGEHVVYPLQGVGLIKDIRERLIGDKKVLSYVIYIDVSDMTVSIPVEKIQQIGIRALVNQTEAKKAIKSVADKYEPANVDWKTRYLMNLELVKEGSIQSIVKVVQGLYHRSKTKELPVQERKLYDNAIRLLVDECAFSLGRDQAEVEAEIFANLEK